MSFKNKILLVGNSAREANLSPKLRQEGFYVDNVENHFEAKNYLNRSDSKVQVILCGLSNDNEMNLNLLQKTQIFEKKRSYKLPIIFFSKKSKLENLFVLSNYGYCDYINQPFKFDELMLKIKTNSYLNINKYSTDLQLYDGSNDNYYKLFNKINSKLFSLSNKIENIEELNINQNKNIKTLITKIRNISDEIKASSLKNNFKETNKLDFIEYIINKLKTINFTFYEYKINRIPVEIFMNNKYATSAIDEILFLFINYTNHNNPIRFHEIINEEFYVLKIVSFGFNIYKVKNELDYVSRIFALQNCKLTTNFSKEGMQLLIYVPLSKMVKNTNLLS